MKQWITCLWTGQSEEYLTDYGGLIKRKSGLHFHLQIYHQKKSKQQNGFGNSITYLTAV